MPLSSVSSSSSASTSAAMPVSSPSPSVSSLSSSSVSTPAAMPVLLSSPSSSVSSSSSPSSPSSTVSPPAAMPVPPSSSSSSPDIELISYKAAKRALRNGAQLCMAFAVPEVKSFNALDSAAVSPPPDEYESRRQAIMQEFSDVFREELPGPPPPRPIMHRIPLTDDRPVQIKPFRQSPAELEALRKFLDTHLARGLIEPSTSAYSLLFK
ncbi:hypothetical protein GQ42DRAFT_67999 [Ramicandelaber brevisporus]|nr:hypothetical protein GQ42DRAFT_67999 [Ramicandelaber brevisporus]